MPRTPQIKKRADYVASCRVATPRGLADALVAALGDEPDAAWLEPSVGEGVFLEALAGAGVPADRITAVDLRDEPAPADRRATVHRGTEFLAWAAGTADRFDRVVANPPYLAARYLTGSLREAACRAVGLDGESVGAAANLWYGFLCTCVRLLRPGGHLAFVLPAAWEYANYAADARDRLPRLFDGIAILRSRRPMFRGVQDGCVLLLCRGYRPAADGRGAVVRADVEDRAEAILRLRRPASAACPTRPDEAGPPPGESRRLGDLLDVRIGAVTGDSRFFLMTDADRRARGIPTDACRPVLSKARHLGAAVIDRVFWEELRDRGERVWLFDPPPAQMNRDAVRDYLNLPPEEGGCRRARGKVSGRERWYRVALPAKPDGVICGHASGGVRLCLTRCRRLTVTNTLYAVKFRRPGISADDRAAVALGTMTTAFAAAAGAAARRYAAGLRKLEPGDITLLHVPVRSENEGAAAVLKRADRFLRTGRPRDAARTADTFFDSDGSG